MRALLLVDEDCKVELRRSNDGSGIQFLGFERGKAFDVPYHWH